MFAGLLAFAENTGRIRYRVRPKSRLLDIGCGPGTFIGQLPSTVSVVGIDIATSQIAYAESLYGSPSKHFIAGDICEREIPGRFDYVTMIEVIEHLDKATAGSVLKRAAQYLLPGGSLLLSTPNYRSLWPILEACVNKLGSVRYEEQHILRLHKGSLLALLDECGFTTIRITSFLGVSPFWAPVSWKLSDAVFAEEKHFPYGFLLFAQCEMNKLM